ncbi:hypothetical protein [Clostridium beijerinckii]|uniref:hypothetical protein n=1 Tax=Clostridium beijerinckii TaxID=1520 RepID=UPI0014949028|nr:hypothetical protein [Clostridium beijerinckii]NOW07858.1 hypothetical protein [Clostridium beijerinckii]NYC05489.1 hypothetical protein [Clostridium beijerinckii]
MNENFKKNEEKQEEKKLKKLSLEEFINQGLERESRKKKEMDIPIDGFGLITFIKPSEDNLLEFLNAQANAIKMNKEEEIIGTNLRSITEAAKEFIYFSCPFLQNTELHKAWGIQDPFDAAVKAFGVENLPNIANQIKDTFGDGKKTKKKIKNS